MLNPCSPAALDAHLKLFKTPKDVQTRLRATFHDSFEYFHAGVSRNYPRFSKVPRLCA